MPDRACRGPRLLLSVFKKKKKKKNSSYAARKGNESEAKTATSEEAAFGMLAASEAATTAVPTPDELAARVEMIWQLSEKTSLSSSRFSVSDFAFVCVSGSRLLNTCLSVPNSAAKLGRADPQQPLRRASPSSSTTATFQPPRTTVLSPCGNSMPPVRQLARAVPSLEINWMTMCDRRAGWRTIR